MNTKSEIGKLGEDMASQYLLNKNFTIVERNFRKPWGELDIVAKSPEGVLVFIEVKAMRKYGNYSSDLEQNNPAIAGLNPEDNLTAAKLKKVKRTAQLYAGFNENLINNENGWRIDLIAIAIYGELNKPLTNLLKYCDLKHFENI